MAKTPRIPTPVWEGNEAGWKIWIVRYDDETPIATAVRAEPTYRFQQVQMDAPSPRKVKDWIEGLGA